MARRLVADMKWRAWSVQEDVSPPVPQLLLFFTGPRHPRRSKKPDPEAVCNNGRGSGHHQGRVAGGCAQGLRLGQNSSEGGEGVEVSPSLLEPPEPDTLKHQPSRLSSLRYGKWVDKDLERQK